MPDVIRKVLALLSPKERRQAFLLLGMILVMALLDVVGVASIMPFMAVLANPRVVETNAYLAATYAALYLGLGLGIAHGGIYLALRRRLTRAGKARLAANLGRFQVLTEAFGGIKEVKIAGLEQAFLDRFAGPAYRFARTEITAKIVGQMP